MIVERERKIIMVPYRAQGHVTPMMKLASLLSNFGFQPLIVIPEYIHRRIADKVNPRDGITFVPFEDGLGEVNGRDFSTVEMAMEEQMPAHLDRLIRDLQDGDDVVACVIVDLLASWAVGVAKRCGVAVAGFWPAMAATCSLIASIPDMVLRGLISETGIPQHQRLISFEHDQFHLSTEELPWLIGSLAAKKSRFKFWKKTLVRAQSVRWILINSFPNETQTKPNRSKSSPRLGNGPIIYPVGPLRENGPHTSPTLWDEDSSCLYWLDQKKPNSVVYISFGSWASPIGENKVRSLAQTVEALGRPFVWALGPNWRQGLPTGYIERVSEQGKIVSWVPQVDVLKHKAIGCFLTHCGWNSIMEAIQCRRCMLCYPIAGDQFLNCEYIVRVWRIGVRIAGFSVTDVEEGIKRVLEDNEINRRMVQLSERVWGEEAMLEVIGNVVNFVKDLERK